MPDYSTILQMETNVQYQVIQIIGIHTYFWQINTTKIGTKLWKNTENYIQREYVRGAYITQGMQYEILPDPKLPMRPIKKIKGRVWVITNNLERRKKSIIQRGGYLQNELELALPDHIP